MKKTILILVACCLLAPAAHARYQRGYYKPSSGTYVQGHYKTNANSTKWDNYSTKGNINPYTKQKGYKSPYSTPAYKAPSYKIPRY